MIAVVKNTATPAQLAQFVAWIEQRGLKTDVSHGDDVTIVGIVGDTSRIDPFLLESMSIIDRVQRVSEPFKMASRAFHPQDSVVDCGHGVLVGGGHFALIAGPRLVEGPHIRELGHTLKKGGAAILRGGAFVARTSPYAAAGLGEKALDLLLEAAGEEDMPAASEVEDPRDVELFINKGVDVLEIAAHNARNFMLLKEVGKTKTPVLLKRGLATSLDELLMAAEYVMSEGNSSVILCERGIRTFETRTRSTFDVGALPALHRLTHLPVIGDPSRAAGDARYVRPLAYAATAAGADGLEIEVHENPEEALLAGAEALTPAQFAGAAHRIARIREAVFCGGDEE